MNTYICADCDAEGTSYGIRPAGWGMETTEHAPSTWRRWCPSCWRKYIGLDKPDGTCAHHSLGDVEATQAGDPERRYLRDCRGCGAHWEEFECGRCGKRSSEPKKCPCRTFAPGGFVEGPATPITIDLRVEKVFTAEDFKTPEAQAALEKMRMAVRAKPCAINTNDFELTPPKDPAVMEFESALRRAIKESD